MIDEKKLIEDIHNLPIQVEVSKTVGHTRPFVDTADILECVENQPKVGEWILCSERLPDEIGNYIIYVKDGNGEDYVGMWLYWRGQHLGCNQTYIDDKQGYWANAWSGDPINEPLSKSVIAWMPLPQPYQPTTED